MIRRRSAASIAKDHTDREAVGKDSARGGTLWRSIVSLRPSYRSMPDQPLPDVWYAEAKRIAAALGQDAATAMLTAEQHRRRLVALEGERQVEAKLYRAQGVKAYGLAGLGRGSALWLALFAVLGVAWLYAHTLLGPALSGGAPAGGAGGLLSRPAPMSSR